MNGMVVNVNRPETVLSQVTERWVKSFELKKPRMPRNADF